MRITNLPRHGKSFYQFHPSENLFPKIRNRNFLILFYHIKDQFYFVVQLLHSHSSHSALLLFTGEITYAWKTNITLTSDASEAIQTSGHSPVDSNPVTGCNLDYYHLQRRPCCPHSMH